MLIAISIYSLDLTKIVFGGKIPKQSIRIDNTMSEEQTREIIEMFKDQENRKAALKD